MSIMTQNNQTQIHKVDETSSRICSANQTQIINPTQFLKQDSKIILSNKFSDSTRDALSIEVYENENSILMDLINHDCDKPKYIMKLDQDTKLIRDLFEMYSQLPKILDITQSKPEIPIFNRIDVLKSDSAEIKKFIRKVNSEMIGFYCNHSTIEEKCDHVFKNMTDVYNSDEYREYESFINCLIMSIESIIHYEENNGYPESPKEERLGMKPYDLRASYSMFPSDYRFKKVIRKIITLNGKISEYNSKTNKRCNRCEAAIRKYDYYLFEINRMRDELDEQNKIDESYAEQTGENKYDMKEFMNKNYPTINRFLLKDVQQKFKSTFKINLTFEQLKERLEQTGMFKISNSHNIKYVNRL